MTYKRNYKTTLHKAGFTLIEILVVISIIVILLAILLPMLQRMKRAAKAVICRSNLHQWALAFQAYAGDYNGSFWSGDLYNNGWSQYSWCVPLQQYYGSQMDILLCPMAKELREEGAQEPFAAWGPLEDAANTSGSYGMNNWCTNPAPGVLVIHEREETKDNFRNIYNVKRADRIPLFLDCAFMEGKPYDFDTPPENKDDISEFLVSSLQMKRFCLNRHDGYINSLFLDFSIRKVGLKELWTLKWHRNFNTANEWTRAGGVRPEDWPKWLRKFKDY